MTPVLALTLKAFWFTTVVKVVAVLAVIPLGSLVFVYVFLFKMMSHMQSRLGPMEAGPHGVLQVVAEAGKFLQKEDIFPARADRFVYASAPIVVFVSTFLLYLVIPAWRWPCPPCRWSASSWPGGRRPTSTRSWARCEPPGSSSPTSCRSCWASSEW